MSYNGSIDLISGLRPKNNGTFPLLQAKDVQTREDGTRLDTELEELKQGGSCLPEVVLTTPVVHMATFTDEENEALTAAAVTKKPVIVKCTIGATPDIILVMNNLTNITLEAFYGKYHVGLTTPDGFTWMAGVMEIEQGGTGVNIITAESEDNLPDDAEDGTIAVVECEEEDPILVAAKTYTDEQITKYWTEAPVFDFTSVFDFAQSVAKGGTLEATTYDNGSVFVARAKNEPIKIKVAFNQQQACMNVLPQYFHNEIDGVDDSYCQFTDFVVLEGCLLYMFMTVGVTGIVSFKCQQVTTTPYNPS